MWFVFLCTSHSNWCVLFRRDQVESDVYKNSWGFQSERIMNRTAKTGVKLAELIDKLLGNGKKRRIIVVKFITVITHTLCSSELYLGGEKKKSKRGRRWKTNSSVFPRSADIHVLLGFVHTLCWIERGVSNLITAKADRWDNVSQRQKETLKYSLSSLKCPREICIPVKQGKI